jgi:hypothetical protein
MKRLQFTGDQTASLVLGETLTAMPPAVDSAGAFTARPPVDARAATAGWVCLGCDSREEVDVRAARAKAAGGLMPSEPQDHGCRHGHGFERLDGHHREPVHMSGTPPQA